MPLARRSMASTVRLPSGSPAVRTAPHGSGTAATHPVLLRRVLGVRDGVRLRGPEGRLPTGHGATDRPGLARGLGARHARGCAAGARRKARTSGRSGATFTSPRRRTAARSANLIDGPVTQCDGAGSEPTDAFDHDGRITAVALRARLADVKGAAPAPERNVATTCPRRTPAVARIPRFPVAPRRV